jgi:hypothetical protein
MKQIEILLLRDNESDIMMNKGVLEDGKFINALDVVRNGEMVVSFLEKKWNFGSIRISSHNNLGVNLLWKHDKQVYEYVLSNEKKKQSPVNKLINSSSEKEIFNSNKNLASCYITKPVEPNEFINAVVRIGKSLVSLVQLPEK